MKPEIQLDMRLSSLMAAYPETRSVFAAHGLGELITKESLEAIGPFLTLETALTSHGIKIQDFLHLLQASCSGETRLDAAGMAAGSLEQGATPLMTLMP